MENALDIFQNGLFPFPSARNIKDFFLGSSLWEPTRVPGGKILKRMGDAKDWDPQEFLILILLHTEPPAICQNCPLNIPISYGADRFCSG